MTSCLFLKHPCHVGLLQGIFHTSFVDAQEQFHHISDNSNSASTETLLDSPEAENTLQELQQKAVLSHPKERHSDLTFFSQFLPSAEAAVFNGQPRLQNGNATKSSQENVPYSVQCL